MANITHGPLYAMINSTKFEFLFGSSNFNLQSAPYAVATTVLSTAVTGSTVLTNAVATKAELDKTNSMVKEIYNALIAMGFLST